MKSTLSRHLIVAIDGPAGAGKSTIARRLAARLGCLYIDTGAMYRAVALAAVRAAVPLDDEARVASLAEASAIDLTETGGVLLNGEDVREAIRTPEIAQGASIVAVLSPVRAALVRKQRALGERHSVVMEGRDIGTAVFPDATTKIFLDAEPRVRALRRLGDLRAAGQPADEDTVAREMNERDRRDSTRATNPLQVAPGAVRVDTSGLTLDEVEALLLRIVQERNHPREESRS